MNANDLIAECQRRGGMVTTCRLPGVVADPPPKKSKYRNVKVQLDGHMFDSKKEAKRYGELKAMERAGKIYRLEVHPKWELRIGDDRIGSYTADFMYYHDAGPIPELRVVEDCKGIRTAVYQLKKRLMHALWKIDIVEI